MLKVNAVIEHPIIIEMKSNGEIVRVYDMPQGYFLRVVDVDTIEQSYQDLDNEFEA